MTCGPNIKVGDNLYIAYFSNVTESVELQQWTVTKITYGAIEIKHRVYGYPVYNTIDISHIDKTIFRDPQHAIDDYMKNH